MEGGSRILLDNRSPLTPNLPLVPSLGSYKPSVPASSHHVVITVYMPIFSLGGQAYLSIITACTVSSKEHDWVAVGGGRGRSWFGPGLHGLYQMSTSDTCLCPGDVRAAFSHHHSYSDCFPPVRQKLSCARLCAGHWAVQW